MNTIKQFCNESHINATLIRAVVRQAGGFESFREMADDVTNHGANSGFHGFIYYAETVKFAKANKAAIIEMARQMADDLGESGPIALITGFNCLKGESQDSVADGIYNPRSDNAKNVLNALAWFALEEVSRSYVDAVYNAKQAA